MSYLWRRFQEDGMDVVGIQENIEEVLVKTLMVADDAIPNQPNSFELYGFDIMLVSCPVLFLGVQDVSLCSTIM